MSYAGFRGDQKSHVYCIYIALNDPRQFHNNFNIRRKTKLITA